MFTFNQIIPIPLKEQNIGASEVWRSTLQLRAGQRCFVSAPSGKGKTTMQLILYGIRKDYEGTVSIVMEGGEKDLRKLSLEDWAKLRQNRIAIIFQDLRLFPQLSALENIQLKNNLTKHKSEQQIQAMAERLGVAEFLNKQAGILSYGQRQRVAIIRALCQPFELLLMDEPFSHLDAENIQKCCALISEECAAQKAGYLIASLGERYPLEYDSIIQL